MIILNFYKFLLYKIYRYAKSQEETVSVEFGFLCFTTLFQLIHLVILGVFLRDKLGVGLPKVPEVKFIGFIIVIIGCLLNYFLLLRNKKIEKINMYYQGKNISVIKGNLLFFGYLVLLFVIMFSLSIP